MYNTAICAIIKDEHLYLEEWIEYHLNLGFKEIYLYEDYDSVSHADIVMKYKGVYLSTVQNVGLAKGNPMRQNDLYDWFTKEYQCIIDLCLFIDIDEFLVLEDGITFRELCDKVFHSEYDAMAFYWKTYNANGHIERPQGKVRDVYTQSIDNEYFNRTSVFLYKSFVKLHDNIKWVNCHKPNNTCDTEGRRIDINPKLNTPTLKTAYIAHYFTKSWEDYQNRLKRGNITRGIRYKKQFFELNPDLKHLDDSECSEIVSKREGKENLKLNTIDIKYIPEKRHFLGNEKYCKICAVKFYCSYIKNIYLVEGNELRELNSDDFRAHRVYTGFDTVWNDKQFYLFYRSEEPITMRIIYREG